MDGVFLVKAAAVLGAAFIMGLGSIGPAIGQGLIGMKACENVGKYPENSGNIRTAMFISLGFVETCALYCLVIAYMMLSFAKSL